MSRGKAATVMGISLKRSGPHIVVTAEDIYGHEVELIRERADDSICHHISEHGINLAFDKVYQESIK